jgi:ATP-dependent DNA ligase
MLLRTPTSFIGPCLPSSAERPPTGPEWVHEIKHDGHRIVARRVRLPGDAGQAIAGSRLQEGH